MPEPLQKEWCLDPYATLPRSQLGRWLSAMRMPFTSVAVTPFAVGVYLAYRHGALTSALASGAGLLAVFLICICCYLLGEIFDRREDLATLHYGISKFAGGSRLVALGVLSRGRVATVAVISLLVALALGVLVVVIQRALWLFGLGLFGAAAAVLYSTPPVRLVATGFGELFIGICYGWLTLVTGYACASGAMLPHSLLLASPIACTVSNVIFINEFPDFDADAASGKRNLLQRMGRERGAWLYALSNLASAGLLLALWLIFRPGRWELLAVTAPVAALAVVLGLQVALRGRWRERSTLEWLCGFTVVLNLLSAITVGVLARWS